MVRKADFQSVSEANLEVLSKWISQRGVGIFWRKKIYTAKDAEWLPNKIQWWRLPRKLTPLSSLLIGRHSMHDILLWHTVRKWLARKLSVTWVRYKFGTHCQLKRAIIEHHRFQYGFLVARNNRNNENSEKTWKNPAFHRIPVPAVVYSSDIHPAVEFLSDCHRMRCSCSRSPQKLHWPPPKQFRIDHDRRSPMLLFEIMVMYRELITCDVYQWTAFPQLENFPDQVKTFENPAKIFLKFFLPVRARQHFWFEFLEASEASNDFRWLKSISRYGKFPCQNKRSTIAFTSNDDMNIW